MERRIKDRYGDRILGEAMARYAIEAGQIELLDGFESFMYAMTTDPRPHHDSRSYVWTTLPREWIAEYDRNAYVEIDPRFYRPAEVDYLLGDPSKAREVLGHKERLREEIPEPFGAAAITTEQAQRWVAR